MNKCGCVPIKLYKISNWLDLAHGLKFADSWFRPLIFFTNKETKTQRGKKEPVMMMGQLMAKYQKYQNPILCSFFKSN